MGSSNAVNLTDGLDDWLSAAPSSRPARWLCSPTSAATWCLRTTLNCSACPWSANLPCFADRWWRFHWFLWYNAHPAEVFMGEWARWPWARHRHRGDYHSPGAFASLYRGIFILEAVSVVLQVGSYKLRNGKRIFKWRRCITISNS